MWSNIWRFNTSWSIRVNDIQRKRAYVFLLWYLHQAQDLSRVIGLLVLVSDIDMADGMIGPT